MTFYNAALVIYPWRMSDHPLPLLTRLRRHRGLWVLAMAVLMIKLVAGSVCLTDGPAASATVQSASALSTVAVLDTAIGDAVSGARGCLLGEAGDCHCACAHTMPMPATAPFSIARVDAQFESPAIHAGFTPASTRTPLRPPIA